MVSWWMEDLFDTMLELGIDCSVSSNDKSTYL
jgi:hypothetical protein